MLFFLVLFGNQKLKLGNEWERVELRMLHEMESTQEPAT